MRKQIALASALAMMGTFAVAPAAEAALFGGYFQKLIDGAKGKAKEALSAARQMIVRKFEAVKAAGKEELTGLRTKLVDKAKEMLTNAAKTAVEDGKKVGQGLLRYLQKSASDAWSSARDTFVQTLKTAPKGRNIKNLFGLTTAIQAGMKTGWGKIRQIPKGAWKYTKGAFRSLWGKYRSGIRTGVKSYWAFAKKSGVEAVKNMLSAARAPRKMAKPPKKKSKKSKSAKQAE
jgi:hypothetical protein